VSITRQAACATLLVASACAAQAQRPVAHPSRGQERQDRDDGECQVWATTQTGVDPATLAAD
jgi:hypothetical protein